MLTTFLLIVIALISYLLGSINGAIIASKLIFHKDIRELGSGNAGLTNFLRNFGPGSVIILLVIDVLKSVISIVAGRLLLGIVGYAEVGGFFAAFCLALGHSYPIYYGFRGGKGVLCTGISIIVINWKIALICLTVFALIIIFTRYVSLGSMLGALCLPICVFASGYSAISGTLAVMLWLLIIWKHRSNIARIIVGTESKVKFGKKSKPTL